MKTKRILFLLIVQLITIQYGFSQSNVERIKKSLYENNETYLGLKFKEDNNLTFSNGEKQIYLIDYIVDSLLDSPLDTSMISNRNDLKQLNVTLRTNNLAKFKILTQDSNSIELSIFGSNQNAIYFIDDSVLSNETCSNYNKITNINLTVNNKQVITPQNSYNNLSNVNFLYFALNVRPIEAYYDDRTRNMYIYIFDFCIGESGSPSIAITKLIYNIYKGYIGYIYVNPNVIESFNCYYNEFIGF